MHPPSNAWRAEIGGVSRRRGDVKDLEATKVCAIDRAEKVILICVRHD
jgi:hypothetical protein